MMPIDLYGVRHGESDRNFANRMLENGEFDYFTKQFIEQPSALARLTDEGRMQAARTGEWLREHANLGPEDGYFVSSYIRAIESAGLLGLPHARWRRRNELRERSAGDWESLSGEERRRRIKAQPTRLYEKDPWNWSSPNGESFADVAMRVWIFLHGLHEGYGEKRAVIMCHGYLMLALRQLLERMPDETFRKVYNSRDPDDRTHNCLILHYTRMREDGTLASHYVRMRKIVAWDPSLVSSAWTPIERQLLSNDELLEIAGRYPRLTERKQAS